MSIQKDSNGMLMNNSNQYGSMDGYVSEALTENILLTPFHRCKSLNAERREEAAACIRVTGPRADGWEWKIQLLLYSELCPLSRQGNVHKVWLHRISPKLELLAIFIA